MATRVDPVATAPGSEFVFAKQDGREEHYVPHGQLIT